MNCAQSAQPHARGKQDKGASDGACSQGIQGAKCLRLSPHTFDLLRGLGWKALDGVHAVSMIAPWGARRILHSVKALAHLQGQMTAQSQQENVPMAQHPPLCAPSPSARWRLGPPADHPVLVVGGCGGIGWALCQALLEQGVRVAVMDLPQALERRDLSGLEAALALDLADRDSIAAAFGALAGNGFAPRQLVLASGFVRALSRVGEGDGALWDATMAGNLTGLAQALAHALPAMRGAGGGAVTALSTAIGQIGSPGYGAYGAAKAGFNALIRTVAQEEAPLIRANAVAPGAVDTAFIRGGFGAGAGEDGPPARISLDAYARLVPLGRIATAEDVVGPILFLMSDAARYITGQVLHVNGGAFLRD